MSRTLLASRTAISLFSAAFFCAAHLVFAPHGAAQSGRRASAPPPASQTTPPPLQQPPVARPADDARSASKKFLLFVAKAAEAPTVSIHYPELYRESVTDRLRDSASLTVSPSNDLKRGEARARAKASADEYVVWLQIEERAPNDINTRRRYEDVENLRLRYEVFAPGTGATFAHGVVVPRATARPLGRPGIGVSYPATCYPNLPFSDFALLEASLEVADRIMEKLAVPPPPRCGATS